MKSLSLSLAILLSLPMIEAGQARSQSKLWEYSSIEQWNAKSPEILEIEVLSTSVSSPNVRQGKQSEDTSNESHAKEARAEQLLNEALELWRTGQSSGALAKLQQALVLYQEVGNRQGERTALIGIGSAYDTLGQYPQALESYRQALAINQELDNPTVEGVIFNNMGAVYDDLGQYRQALEHYEQALAIRQTVNDRAGEGDTLNNIGLAYANLGQYRQALGYYEQALTIGQELGNRISEGNILNNMGAVYDDLGQYPQALEHYGQALSIKRETSDRNGEGVTLNNLGLVYANLGQYPQALKNYEQALAIGQESNDPIVEGRILNNIGSVYDDLGQYRQALQTYNQALAIRRDISDRNGEGGTLNNIGIVYFNLGEYAQALETYRQALTILQEVGDRAGEGTTLNNIGAAHRNLGELQQALNIYEQALTILRETGNRPVEGRTLNNIGYTLLQANQLASAETHFTQALSVLESIRDNDLTDDSKVALFETQLGAYKGLQKVLITQNKVQTALEISEKSRARAFSEILESRLSNQSDIATNSNPPNFSEIQTIAQRQQTTLVEYSIINTVVGNPALYIWVISPDGKAVFRQVDLTDISLPDLVFSSRNAIGARSRATITAFPTATVRNRQQTDLKRLYQLLIAPIADLLPTDPNQSVVFIPQDELFLVPFPALLDENDQHLIQKHTILTAPSIQVLDLTQKQQSRLGSLDLATLGSSDALLVGNPTMPEVYNPSSDSLEQLPPLSGAGDEAITIGNSLGLTPLIGDEATEATVKAQIENARLIHLATHGLLDYGDPKETGVDDVPGAIALAPTSTEDGLLTTTELLNLDLTADLVVLSACDTGRGTITGDGVIGLSRGLITAGVPSVIVSLWKVPDDSTALLMTEFYKNWQASGNKAQALREAMLTTMETYPDPVYWSAFTLIGEAR